jgi:hypothetical protein
LWIGTAERPPQALRNSLPPGTAEAQGSGTDDLPALGLYLQWRPQKIMVVVGGADKNAERATMDAVQYCVTAKVPADARALNALANTGLGRLAKGEKTEFELSSSGCNQTEGVIHAGAQCGLMGSATKCASPSRAEPKRFTVGSQI